MTTSLAWQLPVYGYVTSSKYSQMAELCRIVRDKLDRRLTNSNYGKLEDMTRACRLQDVDPTLIMVLYQLI